MESSVVRSIIGPGRKLPLPNCAWYWNKGRKTSERTDARTQQNEARQTGRGEVGREKWQPSLRWKWPGHRARRISYLCYHYLLSAWSASMSVVKTMCSPNLRDSLFTLYCNIRSSRTCSFCETLGYCRFLKKIIFLNRHGISHLWGLQEHRKYFKTSLYKMHYHKNSA